MSKSKYDRSSVTQMFEGVNTFDGALQSKWLFQPVEDNLPDQVFDTEEEACAAQRAYRQQRGYNPITGSIVLLDALKLALTEIQNPGAARSRGLNIVETLKQIIKEHDDC